MKTLAASNPFKIVLLLILFFIGGCQKGAYYTSALSRDQLFGSWVVSSYPKGSKPPMPIETCILTLHKDGTFDAVDVPLVMDFYPELKLKYTTEQGTWKLVDNEAKDTRSRWKLALSFNQTRFGIDWNIIKSANGFELFETTDLDMWMVGYKFRHQ